MFGCVVCNKNGLNEEQIKRYQSIYCGVCRSIKERYGNLERISLNYDMTFVALFLSALYEVDEHTSQHRCFAHPVKKKDIVQNKYIDYAADMTVLLSYYKCLDDWNDEKKIVSKKHGQHLEKFMPELKQRYERQCESVKRNIDKLTQVENNENSLVDEAINYAGMLLSEIFVYKEDFWALDLKEFGINLGKYIYLCDAAIDYKQDMKSKNYNPIIKLGKKPEDMKDIMTLFIGNVTNIFEKLPIIQDVDLMRNILYSGVWQKYMIAYEKGEENKK